MPWADFGPSGRQQQCLPLDDVALSFFLKVMHCRTLSSEEMSDFAEGLSAGIWKPFKKHQSFIFSHAIQMSFSTTFLTVYTYFLSLWRSIPSENLLCIETMIQTDIYINSLPFSPGFLLLTSLKSSNSKACTICIFLTSHQLFLGNNSNRCKSNKTQ